MSEWYQIESNQIIVQVVTKGAELKRLFNKVWNKELLWLADQKVWDRSAPILFPIVGKLKDDEFIFEEKVYQMPRHGFARDSEFVCTYCGDNRLEFTLTSTSETYKMYPFSFLLKVTYTLVESILKINYTVINTDNKEMYFSIGAHPGFDTKNIENIDIVFENSEAHFFNLNSEGLVDFNKPIEFNSNLIKISPELFKNDALIFKKLKSRFVDIVDKKSLEIVRIRLSNQPYFGIWGKPTNQFVCLEPWNGIADTADHDKNLVNKIGIVKLAPQKEFNFNYEIELIKGAIN
jgi:galactose mutarotase-like enzyme